MKNQKISRIEMIQQIRKKPVRPGQTHRTKNRLSRQEEKIRLKKGVYD